MFTIDSKSSGQPVSLPAEIRLMVTDHLSYDDLAKARNVSPMWRATIDNKKKLRQGLFLEADRTANGREVYVWISQYQPGMAIPHKATGHFSPPTVNNLPHDQNEVDLIPHPVVRVHPQLEVIPTDNWYFAELQMRLPKTLKAMLEYPEDGELTGQFITQPPCSTVTLVAKDYEETIHDIVKQSERAQLSVPSGIKFCHIIEQLKQMVKPNPRFYSLRNRAVRRPMTSNLNLMRHWDVIVKLHDHVAVGSHWIAEAMFEEDRSKPDVLYKAFGRMYDANGKELSPREYIIQGTKRKRVE